MDIFLKMATDFLFVNLSAAAWDLAPVLITFAVGLLVKQTNGILKSQKALKDLQISKEQERMLADAALFVVRSINEKQRAAKNQLKEDFKDESPEALSAAAKELLPTATDRREQAFHTLTTLFPNVPTEMVDAALHSAVAAIRPTKEKVTL